MDEDIQRMLADLSTARREVLSAPVGDHGHRPDPRQEAAILANAEAHRNLHHRDVSGGSARGAAMRAWNTESNFETDDAAAKLANHMSGQGHREPLKRQPPHDNDREAFEDRYGEERYLFIEQSGRRFDNDVPSGSSPGKHPRSHARNGGLKASTPRIFVNGSYAQDHGRPFAAAAAPPRDPNRPRAPSPRASGTVKLNPRRQQKDGQNGGALPVITPREQAVKMLHMAAAQRAVGAAATKTNQTPAASSKPETSQQAQPSSAVPAAGETQVSAQVRYNHALYVAAHVGKEREDLIKKYPTCLPYLELARTRLVDEIIHLLETGTQRAIDRYNTGHPERKSLVEATTLAKTLIEHGKKTEIEAEEAKDPALMQAAKQVFTELARRDSVAMPDPESSPAKEEPTPSAPEVSKPAETTAGATSVVQTNSSASAGSGPVPPFKDKDKGPSVPAPAKGSLVATFIDADGKFLGAHQVAIGAPVHANISFTSRTTRFNPRDLIACVEEMAQKMVDRTHGLDGVYLADDGLWVEDEC